MCINGDVKVYPETNFIMNFYGYSKGNPILAYMRNVISCLDDHFWRFTLFIKKEINK